MVAFATDFSTSATIRIAVTREDGKNEKLIGALFKAIASSTTVLSDEVEVLELPCIAHADGADYGRLRETLSDQEWSYVAITSPEAARVLASAWPFGTNTGTTSAPTPKIAAVGKATEQALQDAGIAVSFCPSKATAETLVQELPKQLDGSSTLNVLYPASTKAADTLQEGLQARGFVVTRLNTYDTVTAEWNDGYRASARACRIACFASPSAVKGWVHNTQKDIDLSTTDNGNGGSIITLAACIGETSAKACRKLGWTDETIFSAEQPGMDGWVQAILDAVAYCQSTAIPATLMSVENTTDTAPMLPPA
jgi:uroporphyrinogen-III synthase